MAEEKITLKGIEKSYLGKTILSVPSMGFEAGKIYGIVGPNGSGKSTLLRILALLEEPTSGIRLYDGKELKTKGELMRARMDMTMVIQNPLLFKTTVFKNVEYGLRLRGVSRSERRKKVLEMLERVGLKGFEGRKYYQLSGGETQRVAIARAMVLDVGLLLMDEFTSNVDISQVRAIELLVKEINESQSKTVIFATHELSQAHRLSDTVITLISGRIRNEIPYNLFTALIENEEGIQWARVSDSIRIAVSTDIKGKSHITVRPQDIIVSKDRFDSSAVNSFQGNITGMELRDTNIILTVDIGIKLHVIITEKSFKNMNLGIGMPVYLTFKATAVEVF